MSDSESEGHRNSGIYCIAAGLENCDSDVSRMIFLRADHPFAGVNGFVGAGKGGQEECEQQE
jgi:hypothetical protein